MATQLTPHFTLEEFTLSQTAARMGLENIPTGQDLENVHATARVLERVRTLLASMPVLISSGYRAPAVNQACGGASNSAHMYGLAADFTAPGYGSPIDICKRLEPNLVELGIDQLIHEYNGWVHLAIAGPGEAPRCQCLTINENGTNTGFA
jgi:zinc D-Ala-D-Ala carboxypeptidase